MSFSNLFYYNIFFTQIINFQLLSVRPFSANVRGKSGTFSEPFFFGFFSNAGSIY